MINRNKEFNKFEGSKISIQNLKICAKFGLMPSLRVIGLRLAPGLGLVKPRLLSGLELVGIRFVLGVGCVPRMELMELGLVLNLEPTLRSANWCRI